MGRKRQSSALDVYIGSTHVGIYTRSPSGATAFRYKAGWLDSISAFPLSISLPLSDRLWSGPQVSHYFDGLLPDEYVVRNRIAARENAESGSTFDLLSVIGRDCVGALRFIPEGGDPGNPDDMQSEPISDAGIAKRLASLETAPLGLNTQDDFRISIAGVQEKTAFLQRDGQWQVPLGATPTSHIFKPAMKNANADFSDSPWNEWFCLKLCQALGLETANADVLVFEGKPVLAVERFDRLWKNDVIYRLPQEDMCQALSVPPSGKYQSDGGPGMLEILQLLTGAIRPQEDREAFFRAQLVFWLLAAIDGHAKNFSVFISPGGFRLTPLYDIMSVAPYPTLSLHKAKLAMSFGDRGYYRLKQIQIRHMHQTAQRAGLQVSVVDNIIDDILGRLDEALQYAGREADKAGAPVSTTDPIQDLVRDQAGKLEQGRLL